MNETTGMFAFFIHKLARLLTTQLLICWTKVLPPPIYAYTYFLVLQHNIVSTVVLFLYFINTPLLYCSCTVRYMFFIKTWIKLFSPWLIYCSPFHLQVPDYYTVIKSPMDFGTIRNKIHAFTYSKPSQMLSDVRQIFTNCVEYNIRNSPEYKAMVKLVKHFDRRVKELSLTEDEPSPVKNSKGRMSIWWLVHAMLRGSWIFLLSVMTNTFSSPVQPITLTHFSFVMNSSHL